MEIDLKIDLSLVPTKALLDALSDRYDAFVASGVRFKGEGDERWASVMRRISGPRFSALSVATMLRRKIEDEYLAEAEPDDEEACGA